jgi:ATP-dependent DNA helicase RecG
MFDDPEPRRGRAMTMTREQLLSRLAGTEWSDFEVKAGQGGVPEDAFKTISAFANSSGGWLVFGVAEEKEGFRVVGLLDVDRFQNELLGACRSESKLRRPPVVTAQLHELDQGTVLVLHVAQAARADKPVRVRIKGRWHAYIRVGAGDHRCRPEEEGRFVRDASELMYDQSPCSGRVVSDLDADSLDWLRGLIEQRRPAFASPKASDEQWLRSLGLATVDGTLTRAAVLLMGQSGAVANLLPRGIVDLRVMHSPSTEGIPSHRWDDRRFCDGNIVQAIRVLFERFHQLCPQPFELEATGPHRRSRSREEEALREALVNLVSHQDYGNQSHIPTILWWRDRIVFENPGDSWVAPELLEGGGHSLTRNPLIARLLRQAELAEQAGTGLPMILTRWRESGRVAPEIFNDAGTKRFRISFPWGESGSLPGQFTGQVAGQVTGQVVNLLRACAGERSRGELQQRLGLRHRDHFNEAYLRPAMDAGLIEMTVPDKPRSRNQRYRLTALGRSVLGEKGGDK